MRAAHSCINSPVTCSFVSHEIVLLSLLYPPSPVVLCVYHLITTWIVEWFTLSKNFYPSCFPNSEGEAELASLSPDCKDNAFYPLYFTRFLCRLSVPGITFARRLSTFSTLLFLSCNLLTVSAKFTLRASLSTNRSVLVAIREASSSKMLLLSLFAAFLFTGPCNPFTSSRFSRFLLLLLLFLDKLIKAHLSV